MTGIDYRFKARVRPDTIFVKPFPDLETLKFENIHPLCMSRTVLYPNADVFGLSAEDSFIFGKIITRVDYLTNTYQRNCN
jgi:hypothetical protein